jgi:N-acetylglutamate synthase-like GNAT family acetyltransferase
MSSEHARSSYALSPVAADTPAWNDYHEIARTSLFKSDRNEYYDALKMLDSYYAKMTPLLLSFNGEAIGTVALDRLADGKAALRMVAVEQAHQGQGHGRVLLGSLLTEFARSQGITQLCVNADANAIGYYSSLGFTPGTWSGQENENLRKNNANAIQMVRDIS